MKKSISKFIALFLSIMLVMSILSACGAATEKPAATTVTEAAKTTETTKEAEKPAEPVTLTVLYNQSWEKLPYLERSFKLYQDKTGNKLDLQGLPIDTADQVMKTKFATGEIPNILIHFGGNGLVPFQPEKNFMDMSSENWAADIKDFAMFQVKYKDKVYGLPLWEGSVSGMLYNKDIFTKFNISVPKTQTEFLAACETLKKNNVIPIYMGFKDVWPLLPQFGLDVVVKDPAVMAQFNSNQTTYAATKQVTDMLAFYKLLADKGYLGKKFASNDFANMEKGLGEGKYAMVYCWDTWLQSNMDKAYPGMGEKFGLMPIFLGVNDEGTYEGPNAAMFFACNTGKNDDAAKAFVNFLAQPEILNEVYKDVATQTYFKSVTTNKPSQQYLDAKESVDKLINSSYAWGGLIGFDQVETVKPIQELMLGGKTVEQAAKEMDDVRIKTAKAQQTPGF